MPGHACRTCSQRWKAARAHKMYDAAGCETTSRSLASLMRLSSANFHRPASRKNAVSGLSNAHKYEAQAGVRLTVPAR